MAIEGGAERRIPVAEVPAEKSTSFEGIQGMLDRAAKSERPAYALKGVWDNIQDIQDVAEKAVLEGLYEKQAEQIWSESVLLLKPQYDRGNPVFNLEQIEQELKDFPFANEETRSGLMAQVEEKWKGLGGRPETWPKS